MKEHSMTDHIKAAMAAVTLMASARNDADAAKAEGSSARQMFAKSALLATAALGRAGLDAVKSAFDKLDKSIRDKAKGAVSETLGIIRYVVDGNALPKTDKTPAITSFGDLLATDVALSGFVKVWRETKGRESGAASNAEVEEALELAAGIVALGLPAGANSIDATVAAKAGNDYHGYSVTDIRTEGFKALEAERAVAEAEAAKVTAAEKRLEVIRYLLACSSDDFTSIMDAVGGQDIGAIPMPEAEAA